ncbi:MAG: hypothetical protein ACSHXL_04325 [Bacteroidota bacterium]
MLFTGSCLLLQRRKR